MIQEQNTAGKAEKTTGNKKKRTVVISVVSAVAVAAVVLGVGFSIQAHNEQVAHEQAVSAARTSCKSSLLRLTKAKSAFDQTLKDGKTLDSVKKESKDSTTLVGCKSDDPASLRKAAKANDKAADSLSAQNGRLASAVKQANGSKAQKDSEAAQAAQKAKEAQEAAQAQAAQQAAQAQAAQQAQQQAQATPRYTAPRYSAPRYSIPAPSPRPAQQPQQQSHPSVPNGGHLGAPHPAGPSDPVHIDWGD